MNEQRDPVTCPSCGTVNPWLNKECRSCGESLSQARNENASSAEDGISAPERISSPAVSPDRESSFPFGRLSSIPGATPKRSWNIRWILAGIFFYGVAMVIGEFVVVKWVVAPDAELSALMREIQENVQAASELDDAEKDKYRAVLARKPSFVLAFALFVLLPPLLVGAITGYFSNRILEGAASMGLAVVLYSLGTGQAILALTIGPINAGLGAAGAYFGRLLRIRIKAN